MDVIVVDQRGQEGIRVGAGRIAPAVAGADAVGIGKDVVYLDVVLIGRARIHQLGRVVVQAGNGVASRVRSRVEIDQVLADRSS